MRLVHLGLASLVLVSLAVADAPTPGPTAANLITQRYAELVQQQLVFPLDPSTPNTPENQLDGIVNHFRGLSVQFQRLEARLRQSEQVVGMLSVSNDKLVARLRALQALPLPALPAPEAAPEDPGASKTP